MPNSEKSWQRPLSSTGCNSYGRICKKFLLPPGEGKGEGERRGRPRRFLQFSPRGKRREFRRQDSQGQPQPSEGGVADGVVVPAASAMPDVVAVGWSVVLGVRVARTNKTTRAGEKVNARTPRSLPLKKAEAKITPQVKYSIEAAAFGKTGADLKTGGKLVRDERRGNQRNL